MAMTTVIMLTESRKLPEPVCRTARDRASAENASRSARYRRPTTQPSRTRGQSCSICDCAQPQPLQPQPPHHRRQCRYQPRLPLLLLHRRRRRRRRRRHLRLPVICPSFTTSSSSSSPPTAARPHHRPCRSRRLQAAQRAWQRPTRRCCRQQTGLPTTATTGTARDC